MFKGREKTNIKLQKSPNKGNISAEAMEERGLTKGNASEQNTLRTQGRVGVQTALGRIRKAVEKDRKQKFTALYYHVYNVDMSSN